MNLVKFFDRLSALTPAQRAILPLALASVVVVRLELSTVGYKRTLAALPPLRKSADPVTGAGDIAWAVRAVSRVVPGATCLTQALAARALLNRQGIASELRLGAARGTEGDFKAHAWLEVGGKVVIGGGQEATFTPLSGPRA